VRKLIILVAVTITPLSLGACAGGATHTAQNSSQREIDRLDSQCKAQGGILVPSGRMTGREPLDNVCKINGGASLFQPPPGVRLIRRLT
jgi:hypothetical protein